MTNTYLNDNYDAATRVENIAQALRSLSRSEPITDPWLSNLTVVKHIAQQKQNPSSLDKDNSEDAELLRLRFFDGHSAQKVAHQLNRSERSIFYLQRKAIQRLSDLLSAKEYHVQETQLITKIDRRKNLLPMNHRPLFGLDPALSKLKEMVLSPVHPWVINVVGMGGIGKTTLAHSMASLAASNGPFEHIVWITIKREEFNTRLGQSRPALDALLVNPTSDNELLTQDSNQPKGHNEADASIQAQFSMSYEALLDAIAYQVGFDGFESDNSADSSKPNSNGISHTSAANTYVKHQELNAFLEKYPALIVLDNLETVADTYLLIDHCRRLVQPSKLILTSRYGTQTDDVTQFNMNELSLEDSLALLRAGFSSQSSHAETSEQIDSIEDAKRLEDVYALVGGNPLVLKLVATIIYMPNRGARSLLSSGLFCSLCS